MQLFHVISMQLDTSASGSFFWPERILDAFQWDSCCVPSSQNGDRRPPLLEGEIVLRTVPTLDSDTGFILKVYWRKHMDRKVMVLQVIPCEKGPYFSLLIAQILHETFEGIYVLLWQYCRLHNIIIYVYYCFSSKDPIIYGIHKWEISR